MNVDSDNHPQYLHSAKLKKDKIEQFDQYPFTLPLLQHFNTVEFHPKVTFFVGENGSGKSTFLEALAVAWGFNPEGGTKNFSFSTRDSHSSLWQYLRLSKSYLRPKDGFFLRAESFFNVASEIENLDSHPSFGPPIINSYGGKSLHEQSHGESFFALMKNRFRGHGLYILDEPEAALSPTRQLAMLRRLHELVEDGSQFIIATHSPILMAYPEAKILSLDDGEMIETAYKDTEHYIVTKRFLNNHDKAIDELLDDSDY